MIGSKSPHTTATSHIVSRWMECKTSLKSDVLHFVCTHNMRQVVPRQKCHKGVTVEEMSRPAAGVECETVVLVHIFRYLRRYEVGTVE